MFEMFTLLYNVSAIVAHACLILATLICLDLSHAYPYLDQTWLVLAAHRSQSSNLMEATNPESRLDIIPCRRKLWGTCIL